MSSPGQQVVSHLLAPPLERSGRETPVSVDSIPLEWDHTVDVGGSSHEEDEEATFFSALSGRIVLICPELQEVMSNVNSGVEFRESSDPFVSKPGEPEENLRRTRGEPEENVFSQQQLLMSSLFQT